MSLSREQLLGHLLGALDGDEQRQVDSELNQHPEFRRELEIMQRRLAQMGLDQPPPPFDPPTGLAARTCRRIAEQAAKTQPAAQTVCLSPENAHGWYSPRNYKWSDLLAGAAIVLIAAAIFFPSVLHSRIQQELALCQHRLRQIGFGLFEYSERQPDHSFPAIPEEGNRAVAGSIAPTLVSLGYVNDPRMFICPGSTLAENPRGWRMPKLEELDRARGEELTALQQTMGGSFAYNMGFVSHGQLVAPQNLSRERYPLLGDAPSDENVQRRTANHGGRGVMMFYEDGHITFVPVDRTFALEDDPYFNRRGEAAAGIDRNDSVLGASHDRPLPLNWVKQ